METINANVLTFVFNAIWQTLVVACVAALCARTIRHAPARYLNVIWSMALAMCLLVPAASVGRHWNDRWASTSGAVSANELPTPAAQSAGSHGPRERFVRATHAAGPLAGAWEILSGGLSYLESLSRSISMSPQAGFAVVLCYGLLLGFHALRLGRAWRRTRAIAQSARPCALSAAMLSSAERCRKLLGLRAVSILASPRVSGPVTLGVFRPAIILPEYLLGEISSSEALSVFAHETAHIRRRDYLMNCLFEIVLLPLAFHPVAWWIRRKIGETREIACDEMAARCQHSGADYAEALIALARRISAAPSLSGYSLGVFDADILEERIMRILHHKDRLNGRGAKLALVLGVFLLAASCALAATVSLGVSQTGVSPATDSLKPWLGTWVAKLKGKPMTRVVLRSEGTKVSGTITSFHVTLDDQGQPAEAGGQAHVWQIQDAKAVDKTLTLAAEDGEGPAREFQLIMTSPGEARFRVVGAPPPPGASDDQPGLKMMKVNEAAGRLPDSLQPFVGTWQAMFEGKSFTTLRLFPEGAKLAGSMSPCRIEMDANGKLTRAERQEQGSGWQIIEATLVGSQLHLKAKEDGSQDVDQFEMKLTSDHEAEFKPAGAPMPIEPWKMIRETAGNGSRLLAPAPTLASLEPALRSSRRRVVRRPDPVGNRQAGDHDRGHE